MILTSKKIPAAEALKIALINECVPKDQVLARAKELARAVVWGAPLAIGASKAVAISTLSSSLERSVFDQHPATVTMLMSHGFIVEGPTAFSEKRHPIWQGK